MKRNIRFIMALFLLIAFTATSIGLDSIAVSSIKLNTSNVKIQVGKTFTLKVAFTPANATNKKLTFSSGNKKIATVDKNGKIKGIIPGKTVITVTSVSNKKAVAKCNVVVSKDGFNKKLKITWIVYNQFDNPIKMGTETQKIIEDRFNVELVVPELDIHNKEQWTVYWASGNTADRIISNSMNTYFYQFADQGIIRPVTKDMLYKYAPNWMKNVEEIVEPKIFTPQITYKGKVWMLPYTNIGNKIPYIMAARKSWMDKVGIKKAPETLDEFYTMAYKFSKEDPDGNGKADTYGLRRHQWNDFGYVWGTFGVFPNAWYDVNNKVIYASASNKYKEGLKLLNKWYKEGLIDPEFITDTRDIERAKWADGKVGLLEDHPWWFAASTPNNLEAMLKKKFPNEELVYFPPVKGPDGNSGAMIGYPGVVVNAIYFGADTSDEKVERILQIEDAFVSDWNFYVRCYYGEQGKTYVIDDDDVITPVADILTKEKISKLGLMQSFALIPSTYKNFVKETKKADLKVWSVGNISKPLFIGRAFVTSGESLAAKEKSEDISRISKEFYFNAITGKISIEAEWDKYIKALNDAGLQKVLDEYEKLIVR